MYNIRMCVSLIYHCNTLQHAATHYSTLHTWDIQSVSIKIEPHRFVRECFRMVCSKSQRLHHHHTCAPPHSLHQLYLPVLLLPTNVCTCEITYVHTRKNTRLGDNTPSPSTHKGGAFERVWTHTQTTSTHIIEKTSEMNREGRGERGGGVEK